jgi:hypothetical protein
MQIMKNYLIIALLGISTLVHATTCTVFSGLNCNNSSYNCSLQSSLGAYGGQISDCNFTFTSCSTPSTGLLYCNLFGGSTACTVGSQTSSTTTWVCNLDSNGLTYLNNCLYSGNCNFGIGCSGNWNIGSCCVNYTCPTPHNHVPDTAMTVGLLGFTLLGVELFRRRLVVAGVSVK